MSNNENIQFIGFNNIEINLESHPKTFPRFRERSRNPHLIIGFDLYLTPLLLPYFFWWHLPYSELGTFRVFKYIGHPIMPGNFKHILFKANSSKIRDTSQLHSGFVRTAPILIATFITYSQLTSSWPYLSWAWPSSAPACLSSVLPS